MSSPAERLAAAKSDLESHYTSAASYLTRRAALESPSARERLAAARDQLEAAFNGLTKRSLPSAADRLAAAKADLEAHFPSLFKRDSLSAADRLAAAKHALEDSFSGATSALVRRADDNKDETVQGEAEMPVSNFQKTVIPIIIGLVLLALFGGVAGFIVYRRRQKNKTKEFAEHRRKNLDLEDDGADEDFGYELPQSQRVQNFGFNGTGASVDAGHNRTGSLKGAEIQAKRDESREHGSKEFV